MINVGVMGLGMMGLTHLDAYGKRSDAKVIAISDKLADRLEGRTKAGGNIDGMAQGGFDYSSVRKYSEGMDLINDPEVQLVDICLPTPMHVDYAVAALKAGKHVLVEKPLARTVADAQRLVEAAATAPGMIMVGMCMRFWPGWTWLKEAIDAGAYGKVRSASFRRLASHPGGAFYCDGAQCGGALLDLHIHDADFIQYVFGVPKAVFSRGYSKVTSELDHITTQYIYEGIPFVQAEGSWCMSKGFPFTMQYTINFETATAVFDLNAAKPLMLYQAGREPEAVEVPPGMGYDYEIGYLLECIQAGRKPDRVTLQDAVLGLRLLEAERQSVQFNRLEPVGNVPESRVVARVAVPPAR